MAAEPEATGEDAPERKDDRFVGRTDGPGRGAGREVLAAKVMMEAAGGAACIV